MFILFFFTLSSANITISTTTSLNNIGLFDIIRDDLFKEGVKIRWIPVGSTKAILLGKSCDVDIVFSHAKELEEKYLKEGYFSVRRPILYDYHTLIGPKKYKKDFYKKDIEISLKIIESRGIKFISRGDGSGTNITENSLWKKYLGSIPKENYLESGSGMINTINIADSKDAITLSDEGSYLVYKSNTSRKSNIVSYHTLKNGELKNIYSMLIVNNKKCKSKNYNDVEKFVLYVLSKKFKNKVENIKVANKRVIYNLK